MFVKNCPAAGITCHKNKDCRLSIETYKKLICIIGINDDDDTVLVFLGSGPAPALLSRELWSTGSNLVGENVSLLITSYFKPW